MSFISQQLQSQAVDFCLYYHLLEMTSAVDDGCSYSFAEIEFAKGFN